VLLSAKETHEKPMIHMEHMIADINNGKMPDRFLMMFMVLSSLDFDGSVIS